MELTVFRWSAALGLTCGALAVAAFPLSTPSRFRARDDGDVAYYAAMDRVRAVSSLEARALDDQRAAAGITRWRASVPATDTARVHFDVSVTTPVRDKVRAVLERQWTALGSGAEGSRSTVFVYLDTVPARLTALREIRRTVDVVQVLPEAAGGPRCLTLVRVRATDAAMVASALPTSVLGACGFYARFGAPSATVRAWLDATSFAAARSSAWSTPRPTPMVRLQAWLDLPSDAGRCLAHGGQPCLAALGIDSSRTRVEGPGPGGSVVVSMPGVLVAVATSQHRMFLADMVRDIGPEKFAAFWGSAHPVPEALASVAGMSADAFTRQWFERTVGHPVAEQRFSARSALWLAMALPLLLVSAARRREDVTSRRA